MSIVSKIKKSWKRYNTIRNRWRLLMLVIFIVAVVMTLLYFRPFSGGLSDDSSHWDHFGSYFGCITGLLAFIGVLFTIKTTNDQNEKNSERDSFFNMLDLHTLKFSNVDFVGQGNNVSYKGAEAFKKYTEEANLYLKHVILYKYIFNSIENGKRLNDLDNLFHNKYNSATITDIIRKVKDETARALNIKYNYNWEDLDTVEKIKYALKKNKIPLFLDYDITGIVIIIIKEAPLSSVEIYEYTKLAADAIYDVYGHILGHYFRNSYYVMKTVDDFNSDKIDNYRALYGAQFSRYEISLGLYNALSSKSSILMINYIKTYKILKDLYEPDLFLFELSNDPKLIEELLNKVSENL